MQQNYKTIGLMGAMPQEIAPLVQLLAHEKETTLGGVAFYEGEFAGKHIVLCCAGMGKVNAAAAAQLLCTHFGVDAILFSGIAGNMTPKISVGDIVIGQTLLYHDAERRMIAECYPHLQEFTAAQPLVAAAQKACEQVGTAYIIGKIATGDDFIGDSATKKAIAEKCNPDCVEMEGAAVAHIASKNDVPFVVLRAMSDDADENAHDTLVGKAFDISEYCATAAKISETLLQLL